MEAIQCALARKERRQKNVVLTPEHEAILDLLKDACGIPNRRVFLRGIELAAKEVAPTLRGGVLSLQA
jgi:hypothetical protein